MKNSVVMVTGGAGFVGSHLVEELLKTGNEVHVFDVIPLELANNLMEVRNHPGLKYFQGDLRKKEDIQRFWMPGASAIFHLASVVGIKNYIADPLKLIDIVVIGTRHILELSASTGVKVVFSSTSEVFGKNTAVPWTEDGDRVLGPTYVDRWCYSSSKAVCEHMCYGMKKSCGLSFTILRFFNVYGPRQNPYFVVSQSIKKVLNNEKPLLYDGGSMTRCFTYVSDIVRGVVLAAEASVAEGEAFNLGNTVEVTMKQVLETALRVSGSSVGFEDVDTAALYGKQYEDIERRIPDSAKAEKLLGWKASIQLEEGIDLTVKWARSNDWWRLSI